MTILTRRDLLAPVFLPQFPFGKTHSPCTSWLREKSWLVPGVTWSQGHQSPAVPLGWGHGVGQEGTHPEGCRALLSTAPAGFCPWSLLGATLSSAWGPHTEPCHPPAQPSVTSDPSHSSATSQGSGWGGNTHCLRSGCPCWSCTPGKHKQERLMRTLLQLGWDCWCHHGVPAARSPDTTTTFCTQMLAWLSSGVLLKD